MQQLLMALMAATAAASALAQGDTSGQANAFRIALHRPAGPAVRPAPGTLAAPDATSAWVLGAHFTINGTDVLTGDQRPPQARWSGALPLAIGHASPLFRRSARTANAWHGSGDEAVRGYRIGPRSRF